MRLGEQDASKRHARRRRRRLVKNTAVFLLILVMVFGAAGFAYTWYAGQQEVDPALDVSTLPKQQPQHKTTPPTKNSQVGVSVQTFNSPLTPGQNASLGIKTLRGAACSITFTYNKDNERSDDTGLIPKIADEYGLVEWTWKISPAVTDGTWPVEVVCANGNKHSYSRSDLVIKR